MTRPCRDLDCAAAGLGKSPAAGLAKAVGAEPDQTRLVAHLAEPIAEARGREGLAVGCREERQVPARRGVERLL